MVDKEEIELEIFADDLTAFSRSTTSLEALIHTADLFGLVINSAILRKRSAYFKEITISP